MNAGPLIDGQLVRIAADVDLHARSGLNAVHVTVGDWLGDFDGLCESLRAWSNRFETEPDLWFPILSADDLPTIGTDERVGVILGMQNGAPIDDRIERLAVVFRLGVRVIQPTYNLATLLADGCLEERNAGLSRLGHSFVRECNRLGIAVDVSHVGDRSAAQIVEVSDAPVLATHVNSRELAPSPRNKNDALLSAIADTGGVVGATTYAPACWRRTTHAPLFDDFARQVEHLLDLLGEDAVAVGSDTFVAGPSEAAAEPAILARTANRYPEILGEFVAKFGNTMDGRQVDGFQSIDAWQTMRDRLQSSLGLDDRVLNKVLGGNWLRVLDRTLRPAP
jgi:membrane dipeptidase